MKIEKIGQQQLRMEMMEEQNKGESLYASKVLQRKSIEGLLDFSKRNMNGQWYYIYSIDGLHTMQEVWDGRCISGEDLDFFWQSLGQTLYRLDDYLLKHEKLCLDPSYIMYDMVKKKWKFLYLVEAYEEQGQNVKDLIEYFINKLGGENENKDILYEFFSDCLQFDDVLPMEVVHTWMNRWIKSDGEDVEPEEGLVVEEQLVEKDFVFEKNIVQGESDNRFRKDKWNKVIYAKLYSVPFCPH